MNPEPVVHKIGDAKLSPSPRAVVAANRLSALDPLSSVEKAMESLNRAEVVMAEQALAQQTTTTVVDQFRGQSRSRHSSRKV
jgi:hypothetical protein